MLVAAAAFVLGKAGTMRTKFLALCLGFALTPVFENALLADVLLFPAANPGDVFSGTFTFTRWDRSRRVFVPHETGNDGN
jgi:hypothetical protein